MEQSKNDILQGPITKTSIKLGIPVTIAHLLILMYYIVDTIYISFINRESTSLMSGIGLTFPIYIFYVALASGLMIGISSLVARAIGEKNQNVLDRVADSGFILVILIVSVTLIIAYIFGGSIIKIMAGSKLSMEAIINAIKYFYFIYCHPECARHWPVQRLPPADPAWRSSTLPCATPLPSSK